SRNPGHGTHQVRTQGVDGTDTQTSRVGQQIPLLLLIALHGRARQLPAAYPVGLGRPFLIGSGQLLQHTRMHFSRSFTGEGNGHNFLWPLHASQQGQNPVSQQLCLARTGWGLHQKGGLGVQCPCTGGAIARDCQHYTSPPLSWRSSWNKRKKGKTSQYSKSLRFQIWLAACPCRNSSARPSTACFHCAICAVHCWALSNSVRPSISMPGAAKPLKPT